MTGAGAPPRLALKVDCDTYVGTRDGLPTLLRLFDRAGVRASFFFTVGPDRSGRAILRVITRKGFLRKMLRSRAISLYGPRTALSGTLLPAPLIGARLGDAMRSVAAAGHEVGVHGWDHVKWHDRLDRMPDEDVTREYALAHREFERIFGRRARASAAPGWHATATSLVVQERYQLTYASNTRGNLHAQPFFPVAGGRTFSTLEIPTTLPTLDEVIGTPRAPDESALVEYYRGLTKAGTQVHSIHTEGEGTALSGAFTRQLDAWRSDGVTLVTLEELAREALDDRTAIARGRLTRVAIDGRAGLVTGSEPVVE